MNDNIVFNNGSIDVAARPRRRGRLNSISLTDKHNLVQEYIPNAHKLYDKLYELETLTLDKAGTMTPFVERHLLNCRIYYAFVFHLRCLQIRRHVKLTSHDENQQLDRIDAKIHIDSLPLHDEMYEVFRLTFPFIEATRTLCAIAPASITPPKFELDLVDPDHVKVLQCLIPHSHQLQPSPRLGINLQKWYLWKAKSYDETELPNAQDRFSHLVLGTSRPGPIPEPADGGHSIRAATQRLFSSPMFKHPLPIHGGMTIEHLLTLKVSEYPPDLPTPRDYTNVKQWRDSELLFHTDYTWINRMKSVISTLANICSEPMLLSETTDYYDQEEVQTAIRAMEDEYRAFDSLSFPTFGVWMAIFDSRPSDCPADNSLE